MQMHIVLNQEDREVKFSSDVFFFYFNVILMMFVSMPFMNCLVIEICYTNKLALTCHTVYNIYTVLISISVSFVI